MGQDAAEQKIEKIFDLSEFKFIEPGLTASHLHCHDNQPAAFCSHQPNLE